MADHRPDAYLDMALGSDLREVLILRASSIDRCERAMILAATGVEGAEVPDKMLLFFS